MWIPAEVVIGRGHGNFGGHINAHLVYDANGDPHLILDGVVVQDSKINRNGRKYNLGEETTYAENN